MSKITVHVNKAFVLTREDKSRVAYSVGTHSMPEEDAGHWYTKPHIAKPEVREENVSAVDAGTQDTGDNADKKEDDESSATEDISGRRKK
ncbi:MAG: hypothetical protein VST70_01645 [Nitrospirota bacterium]|nr:hypothetical protein [Nitrospirota bacterium]